VEASRDAYELSEQRFQDGMDDYLALLDAHRTLYSTQQALVRRRLTRLTNPVNLYKTLGGWSAHTGAIQRHLAVARPSGGIRQSIVTILLLPL